ncbi:hypothetical protein KP509_10G087800 [Ceratopteris richardii]|uniref:NAD(P)-binding domain-containing protein n=1 Tax=Ceratopteris richardii TaxID=49495 RepID=A0A8T2U710_CERRI|nr:hypothetical protein KP509_10G087800 [Ceratopteris richardii]
MAAATSCMFTLHIAASGKDGKMQCQNVKSLSESIANDRKVSQGFASRHQLRTGSIIWNMNNAIHRKPFTLKVRSQIEEPMTIDNSTVLVVGGGGTGMEVVRALAKAGSWVTAFQRGDKFRTEVESLGAMLAIGDVMDPKTIEKALGSNSFDAVVCTVGGGTKNTEVDKDGCINVINAVKKAGIKRFILVSSIGVGDSIKAINEQTLQVLKLVLEAKYFAEEELKKSGLAYTILRPGGLLTGPPSGKGILTEDPSVLGLITRADVALLIMKILFMEEAEMKTLSAIDCEKLQPPTASLEGVKIFSLA